MDRPNTKLIIASLAIVGIAGLAGGYTLSSNGTFSEKASAHGNNGRWDERNNRIDSSSSETAYIIDAVEQYIAKLPQTPEPTAAVGSAALDMSKVIKVQVRQDLARGKVVDSEGAVKTFFAAKENDQWTIVHFSEAEMSADVQAKYHISSDFAKNNF